MGKTIVYYITGHGLGHARRSAQVIFELVRRRRNLTVEIRSSVPDWAFSDVLGPRVRLQSVELDPGAVEDDPLRINPLATQKQVQLALRQKAEIIDREVRLLWHQKVSLVIADIPFLAGDIAAGAGVPCVAISNFTWDWIYQGWTKEADQSPVKARHASSAAFAGLVEEIQASYRKIGTILKLPFGGRTEMFGEVIDVPLIVNRLSRPREQVRWVLGADGGDKRPLVLIGQRGGVSLPVLVKAAKQTPEVKFLSLHPLEGNKLPDNLFHVQLGYDLPFADVLAACDLVVSKFGYGIVADSIAAKVGVFWPARVGFREDQAMTSDATPFLRHQMIDGADFVCGNWRQGLLALLSKPKPRRSLPTDGAAVCAKILERWTC